MESIAPSMPWLELRWSLIKPAMIFPPHAFEA
jgi:hypothetical protein